MSITAAAAYDVLKEYRKGWDHQVAFYKTAVHLGMTPKELSKLLHQNHRKQAQPVVKEAQGTLF